MTCAAAGRAIDYYFAASHRVAGEAPCTTIENQLCAVVQPAKIIAASSIERRRFSSGETDRDASHWFESLCCYCIAVREPLQ
jgi:hypothetical protein